MSDETKRWQAEIDQEIAEAADSRLSHGDRKVLIEKLAEAIANKGFSERTPYDVRITQLKEKRKQLVSKRDRVNEQIDDVDSEIDALREKRSQYEDETEKLEGRIEGVESDLLRRGTNIWPESPIVLDIAHEYDITAEEFVEELKRRNPDIPPYAFDEPNDNQFVDNWTGFDDPSKASLPPDERERHGDR